MQSFSDILCCVPGYTSFVGDGGGEQNDCSGKNYCEVVVSRGQAILEHNPLQAQTTHQWGRRRTDIHRVHDLAKHP